MMNEKQVFRPFAFAVHQLVSGVLEGTFPQGSNLPAERMLAQQLGITRPTLREALQVLATEGWFKIQHGKPTQVAHYLETGNLALLSRLANYPEKIPELLAFHLLDVRMAIMPQVANLAWENGREVVLEHLSRTPGEDSTPKEWVEYDWTLQLLLLKAAENPVFKMIFNGFGNLFKTLCLSYFSNSEGRQDSTVFYKNLYESTTQNGWVQTVRSTMTESKAIWRKILNNISEEE